MFDFNVSPPAPHRFLTLMTLKWSLAFTTLDLSLPKFHWMITLFETIHLTGVAVVALLYAWPKHTSIV